MKKVLNLQGKKWSLYRVSVENDCPSLVKMNSNIRTVKGIFNDHVWNHPTLLLGRKIGDKYEYINTIESITPIPSPSKDFCFSYKGTKYYENSLIIFPHGTKFIESSSWSINNDYDRYMVSSTCLDGSVAYRLPTLFNKFRVTKINHRCVKLEGYRSEGDKDNRVVRKQTVFLKLLTKYKIDRLTLYVTWE